MIRFLALYYFLVTDVRRCDYATFYIRPLSFYGYFSGACPALRRFFVKWLLSDGWTLCGLLTRCGTAVDVVDTRLSAEGSLAHFGFRLLRVPFVNSFV